MGVGRSVKSCKESGVCTDISLQKSIKGRILVFTEYLYFEMKSTFLVGGTRPGDDSAVPVVNTRWQSAPASRRLGNLPLDLKALRLSRVT